MTRFARTVNASEDAKRRVNKLVTISASLDVGSTEGPNTVDAAELKVDINCMYSDHKEALAVVSAVRVFAEPYAIDADSVGTESSSPFTLSRDSP